MSDRPIINITRPGSVVAVTACGTNVTVWVDSPTGDSSDSHLFTFACRTEAQAFQVCEMWGQQWGLDPQFYSRP